MNEFKKTRMMNIIGAIGWGVVGVALFLNKMGPRTPDVVFLGIIIMYAILIIFPAFTAKALSPTGGYALKRGMLWANGGFIALWCVCIIAEILWGGRQLGMGILAALAFVIPQAINIRALRTQTAEIIAMKGRLNKPAD